MNGYFYILRNQTLASTKNEDMKRDKQEIQRLKRALKGRSLRLLRKTAEIVLIYGSSGHSNTFSRTFSFMRPVQSYKT